MPDKKKPELYFVYPGEEDTITFVNPGTVVIDFFSGKVTAKGQSKRVTQLQGRLSGSGREFIRGVRIDADKKVRIYTDVMGDKNLIPIAPSDALETELQEFKILFIKILTANTAISVIASTSLVGFKPIKRRTPSNLVSGQKNVTASGTAEALGSSTPILSVTVTAKRTNTGNIFIGNSTTASSTDGDILAPGDQRSINIDDLAKVFVDAAVSGEGASFIYVF